MNKDEIIRMAREAGMNDADYWLPDDMAQMERFAALVAAHEAEKWKAENKRDYENWKMAAEKAAECERETCAKVCEEWGAFNDVAQKCAAAIRARGEK